MSFPDTFEGFLNQLPENTRDEASSIIRVKCTMDGKCFVGHTCCHDFLKNFHRGFITLVTDHYGYMKLSKSNVEEVLVMVLPKCSIN